MNLTDDTFPVVTREPGSLRRGANIFAEAGLPDAEVRLARWQLEDTIRLQTREMTVAGACQDAGLDRNDIENIWAGQSSGLSIKALVGALKRLGNDVEISVKVTKSGKRP